MLEITTDPIKTLPFAGCEALGGYEIIVGPAPLNEWLSQEKEKAARKSRRKKFRHHRKR